MKIEERLTDYRDNAWKLCRLYDKLDCDNPNLAEEQAREQTCDQLDTNSPRLERAIIADWNATEKAMKAVIARYYRTYKAGWYCHTCGGDELCRPECHTPDNCPVAAAQAALAKMQGGE